MKILFVERRLRIDKLGLCYLTAVLRKAGHEVYLVQDENGENADEFLTANPMNFVMYSTTSDEAGWFQKRNRELKAKHYFISVFGGPHPTFASSWGVDDDAIDFIVRGPGENEILKVIEGSAGRVSVGRLPALESEYFPPDRSLIYKYDKLGKSRAKRFISCRYCLFSCAHCFNSAFKKMYPDQKSSLTCRPSSDAIFQEIMTVKKEYGLELAIFNDDDLAGNPIWIAEFCELLLNADIPVNFCGAIRANTINEDGIKMMAGAGCSTIFIGLESANRDTQILLRRQQIINDDVYNAVRRCEEAGIRVRIHVMIGLPVEDPLADAIETFEFVKQCKPTNCSATIYQPLPGTRLYSYCLEKDLINADMQPSGYFEKTTLKIKNAEEINRLGKLFHWAVNEQWPSELLKTRISKPMSDEVMKLLVQKAQGESARDLYGMK